VSIPTTRSERRAMERQNAKLPSVMERVKQSDWPSSPLGLLEVWRSRDYLVQVYQVTESPNTERMSVCRTSVDPSNGRWYDNIPWEHLQRIKTEIGRGNREAVEVYPADKDVVNVANMRHLFILDCQLPFVWRRA
jgi:hypothetical protein